MSRSRKGTLVAVVALLSGVSANVQPAQAQLNYKVSSIGNSFHKDSAINKWVQNNIAALYVSPDGTCYTNSKWDEGHHEGGIYKNGDLIGSIADLHMNNRGGGAGVAGDDTYIYVANGNQIRRHNPNGSRTSWTNSSGTSVNSIDVVGEIKGMAVDKTNKLLYTTDSDNGAGTNGEIRVYNLTNMTLVRNWTVVTPDRIAVAPDGSVWVAQRKTDATPGRVLHYSSTGSLLSQSIVGGTSNPGFDPTALVFDASGRLLVGDNGPDQQVKIYTNLGNASPTLSATFGAKGGIFSGTMGAVAPLKFNGITGLGVDSAGNIYVGQNRFGPEVIGASGAGSILESYTSAGVRNWRLLGLEFVDCADSTPGTDGTEVYTKFSRYTLNFSNTATNSEWTYAGHTLNQFKYPNDSRFENRFTNWDWSTGYQVRNIGGKKFLFNSSMWGNRLEVFRFNSVTDGEIAIPCAQINGDNIWRDLNANGVKDSGETVNGPGTPSKGGISGYNIDANGNLWQTYTNGSAGVSGVRRFNVQGLDANGVPIWNHANLNSWNQPAPFSELQRCEYIPATDSLYLTGYATSIDPDHKWQGKDWGEKLLGSVVARYDNWSTGNRTARWVQILPDYNEGPLSLAVAGDFLMIGYDGGSYQEDSGHIRIRRASDGVDVGRMWAGPYNIGRMDIENGVRALKRSTGEYIIFTEDDWYARVMMYRWTPPTTAPAAPTLTATAYNTYAKLSWNAPANASIYELKRATTSGGPYTVIARQEGTSFTDTNGGAGLVNGTPYYYVVQAIGPAGNSVNSAQRTAVPSNLSALRINSGGGEVGDYIGDAYVTGGGDTLSIGTISTTGVANAAPAAVYSRVRRKGNPITYTIPHQGAGVNYTVRLHFAEWWNNPGTRFLNIGINGVEVISNLDVVTEAGGKNKALVKTINNVSPNSSGQIIVTIGSATETIVQGLELIPPPSTNLVTNPGFEANAATQTPTGWSESSSKAGVGSGYTEAGGNTGSYRGTHWNSVDYNMYTYQVKTGLANGLYTLRARARRGGGTATPIACYLEAKDFGGTARTANIPTSSTFQLVEIKDINVTNGQCTIGIWSNAYANNWANFDDVEFFRQ